MAASEDILAGRKSKALTQVQLAEKVGVSQATISKIEKGEIEPTVSVLARLAKTLDLDFRSLLPEADLHAILGSEEIAYFFAFCPNPFCEQNEYSVNGDTPTIRWRSTERHDIKKFKETNFCARCGTALVKECPGCGKIAGATGGHYCVTCGKQLTNRPSQEEWAEIRRRVLPAKPMTDGDDDDVPF